MNRLSIQKLGAALALAALAAVFKTGAAKAAGEPMMSVSLVDADARARVKSATVKVEVKNLDLVDPDVAGTKPKMGQGHLHYQLDSGPIIATVSPKLSFHELASGPHTIKVQLAANNHDALGSPQSVMINVP